MLKGLQYVGNGKGLSVMLYKSYKSVDVTWDRPYTFTNRDIVNDDASKYYRKNYLPLGIKLIEDNTILPELDAVKEEVKVEVKEVAEEVVKEVEATPVVSSEIIEEEKVEVEATTETELVEESAEVNNSSLNEVFASIKEEYDAETLSSISESDLSILLDEKLDEDQVRELATMVGYITGRAKNKYRIISGLASSKLDEVVKLILS